MRPSARPLRTLRGHVAAGRLRGPAALGSILLLAVLGSAGTASYTVRSGDNLWAIAQRVGSSVGALARANELADPDRLTPGQVLSIPEGSDAAGSGRSGGGDVGAASGHHVIRHGETLSGIAARYGVSVDTLLAANGLTSPHHIKAGARLALSGSGLVTTAGTSSATHVVARGETLSHVAVRYGTTVRQLMAANDIRDPRRVQVGTRLEVPGGGGWQCPVEGRVGFVDDYAVPKPDGRFHEGIDIFASRGAPAVAPVDGRAQQMYGSRGGHQYWLHGDDGALYIGTHLDSPGADGRVSAGEVLGRVGTSGNARGTSPHLHFEMHPGGAGTPSVNPYALLAESCRR